MLALRIIQRQRGEEWIPVADATRLAQQREPELAMPQKSRSKFAKKLAAQDVIEWRPETGRGGSQGAVRLKRDPIRLSDEQLASLLRQRLLDIRLDELVTLEEVLADLHSEHTDKKGRAGERFAIHLCLALGLRFIAWRSRAPETEIDVLAERVASLGYQRWAVQVKNTSGTLQIDRVNREVGAAMGSGITHLLFVVPRSKLTRSATREIHVRCLLTQLHAYYLDASVLCDGIDVLKLLDALQRQADDLARGKMDEAKRRAGLL